MNAVIFATILEAEFAVGGFGFSAAAESPFKIFKNGAGDVLAISGIGPVRAALCADYVLREFSPKKIFNFGACGILNQTLKAGEVYDVSEVLSLDFAAPRAFKIAESGARLLTSPNPVKKNSLRGELSKFADIVDMECHGILLALDSLGFDLKNFRAAKYASDFSENCDIKSGISLGIKKLRPRLENALNLSQTDNLC
ncbi:MAG: hypothetical protein J6P03_03870 [Opitutales bacterium]|nr:hypothetical protein [Opitutales bacterium]